jgi:hypothetical protein
MIHRCCWCMVTAAVVCAAFMVVLLAENAMHRTPPPAVFKEPANWKYVAAKRGHTFHAKGCPGVPKQLPPDELMYGNSAQEMRNKDACPLCIK